MHGRPFKRGSNRPLDIEIIGFMNDSITGNVSGFMNDNIGQIGFGKDNYLKNGLPPLLELLVDGRVISSFRPNRHMPDSARQGVFLDNKAFEIAIPEEFYDASDHEVEIRLSENHRTLRNGRFTFNSQLPSSHWRGFIDSKTLESMKILEAEFDPEFYIKTYFPEAGLDQFRDNPFQHYISEGMKKGYSPNSWFQEDWYRAFYRDIREAIENRTIPSGFYHYVMAGRSEGRIEKFDLRKALETRMPNITEPVLLSNVTHLRRQLSGLENLPKFVCEPRCPQTVWFLLPMLNPDIAFGGYRAAYALIAELRHWGYGVAILCLEEEYANKEYFLWRESSEKLQNTFADIAVYAINDIPNATIYRNDLFVAYSVWGLAAARQLALLTGTNRPYLLAQEYEPIFYEYSSLRALCVEAYAIPHYPIINSQFLLRYFREERIGLFAEKTPPIEFVNYSVFEHKINRLLPQTAKAMRARQDRVLAAYARPEGHASRNLFEILILALQNLCEQGIFGQEWSFIGLGALSELPPITLGGGHQLNLVKKMSEEDYGSFLTSLDIGVSLIYGPHPTVVPFEFASTGALVVTNVFGNRRAEHLRGICENILPCAPALASVTCAIQDAVEAVGQFELREKRAYHPPFGSWEEIFTKDFITRTFKSEPVARTPPPASGPGGRGLAI